MSISIGPLGTTDASYAHNPDRSGQYAAFLNELALQRSHDRQVRNGEVNRHSGMVDLSIERYYHAPNTQTKEQNTGIPKAVVPMEVKKQALGIVNKSGYNPRYNR